MHKPAATLCTAAKTCGLHKTTDQKNKKQKKHTTLSDGVY